MTNGRERKYSERCRYFDKKRRSTYKLIERLKSEPCTDCGNRFPPECMDFDHCKGTKKFSIGQYATSGKSRLLAEIAKCELVCANCHRIRTKARRNVNREPVVQPQIELYIPNP